MTPADGDAVGSAVVATDLPCVGCRYNLRGLASDGQCPECGEAVVASLRGEWLAGADPAWVARLVTAAACMGWGMAALLASGVVLLAAWVARLALGDRWVAVTGPLRMVLGLGGFGLHAAGVWLLATPEPRPRRQGGTRLFMRAAVVASVAERAYGFVPHPVLWSQARWVGTTLALEAGMAVVVAGIWAMLRLLTVLARRLPDAVLANRADTLMFGLGTPAATLWGLQMAIVGPRLIGRRGPVVSDGAVTLASGLCGLAFVVFGIMYLLLLRRLVPRFAAAVAAPPLAAVGPRP